MNETTTVRFWVGDYVKMRGNDQRFAGYWRVERLNSKTISLADPSGQRAKADASFIVTLTPEERLEASDVFHKAALGEAEKALSPGSTVNLRGQVGVYVVLKQTPRGYSVAKLGGDSGRYWNAAASSITPCTVTVEVQS